LPTVKEGDIEEKDRDEDDGPTHASSSGGTPCVAGEFRSALDTLFETLDDTQPWYVFCINPNDSQLPNQLEGRSVKGQVKSSGLSEIARRCMNVFEIRMTVEEFCNRYKDMLGVLGIAQAGYRDQVERARVALTLAERDVVLGQHKVSLSGLLDTLRFLTFEFLRSIYRNWHSTSSKTAFVLPTSKSRRGTEYVMLKRKPDSIHGGSTTHTDHTSHHLQRGTLLLTYRLNARHLLRPVKPFLWLRTPLPSNVRTCTMMNTTSENPSEATTTTAEVGKPVTMTPRPTLAPSRTRHPETCSKATTKRGSLTKRLSLVRFWKARPVRCSRRLPLVDVGWHSAGHLLGGCRRLSSDTSGA
jgi:hypothetical protein